MVKLEDIIITKKKVVEEKSETKQDYSAYRSIPTEQEISRAVDKISQELKAPFHNAMNLADKLYHTGQINQKEWDRYVRTIMDAFQHCTRLIDMYKGHDFASFYQFQSMQETVKMASSLIAKELEKNVVAELNSKIKNNPDDDFVQ